MIQLYQKRSLWGLQRVFKESLNYERIVKEVFNNTAVEIYGTQKDFGVAVFAYGSPGRFELTGGDSDADVFIAEAQRTEKGTKLRELFKKRLGSYSFSKIDLPSWGTLEEIEIFLRTSLVEGNQIIETRFISGDQGIRRKVEDEINRYDSIEREFSNILFNRLYFNQYFRQRIVNGAPNVKYCPGGSRDFLFFYWYDRLCKKIEGKKDRSQVIQPQVKEGLERLYMEGSINGSEFGSAFEAINAVIELRTDILKVNKSTVNRGLTILDERTINALQKDYVYPVLKEILDHFEGYTSAIDRISQIIWRKTIERAGNIKGKLWEENFIAACNPATIEAERRKIPSDDSLIRLGLIWGASESAQEGLFNELAERYSYSEDWATLCSIACSPICSSKVLHQIGTINGKKLGNGYILRVVARNRNTNKETLRSIAEDPNLEKRYTEVAKIALEQGNEFANNQI